MLIEGADRRIPEQDGAASIGLQPVLVRIDHDRVDLPEPLERPCRLRPEVSGQREIPAIRCVRMEAEAVLVPERQDLRQRIHRADRRRAHRRDDRSDIARFQPRPQRVDVHPAIAVNRD